jgi:hypothetical protein
MNMPKKKQRKPIPRFETEDQEREFWASHDSTEYLDWSGAKHVTFSQLRPSTQMPGRWCTVAPLHAWDIDVHLDEPVHLGRGVTLSHVPDWLTEERIIRHLSDYHREQLIHNIRFVLMLEYDADSLGDPDTEWQGQKPRSKQDRALELFQLANLALWLVYPSSIGFDFVIDLDCPANTWSFRHVSEVPRLIPYERDCDHQFIKRDLDLARELYGSLTDLPRDGAAWIAVHALWKALVAEWWEVRYLLLWVGLEALFGPEDAREITYRLFQRIAFFLASDRKEAQGLFKAATASYSWRSRVVHGMRLTKLSAKKSEEIMLEAEDFLRKTLNRLLRKHGLARTFSGKEREHYLDNLIFSFWSPNNGMEPTR